MSDKCHNGDKWGNYDLDSSDQWELEPWQKEVLGTSGELLEASLPCDGEELSDGEEELTEFETEIVDLLCNLRKLLLKSQVQESLSLIDTWLSYDIKTLISSEVMHQDLKSRGDTE